MPAKAIVVEGAINNAGSLRLELFFHFRSPRSVNRKSFSSACCFCSIQLSRPILIRESNFSFLSRAKLFSSFYFASNSWITKWCLWLWVCVNLVSQFIGGRIHPLIYEKNYPQPLCMRTEHRSYQRCCVHRCQRAELTAPSNAAVLCNDRWNFYYQRSAKSRGARKVKRKVLLMCS